MFRIFQVNDFKTYTTNYLHFCCKVQICCIKREEKGLIVKSRFICLEKKKVALWTIRPWQCNDNLLENESLCNNIITSIMRLGSSTAHGLSRQPGGGEELQLHLNYLFASQSVSQSVRLVCL